MTDHAPLAPKRARLRTITFFEIVRWVNVSRSDRMEHRDWQALLAKLRALPLRQRVISGATRTLIGEALPYQDGFHLKLMVVRDEAAWLAVFDPEAESIDELEFDANNELLETTIVAFLPFGNVIGLIQGSTSAPTASALEDWINGMEFFPRDVRLDTRVMVAHEAQELLTRAHGVSTIEVKMHTNRSDALRARGSRLADVIDRVKKDFGDMTVTVILQASKARDQEQMRADFQTEARALVAASDNAELKKAKAKLWFYEPGDESARIQEVDFAKQRITAKRDVPTVDEHGSPIRNESAVRVILEVANEHEVELRRIVEED